MADRDARTVPGQNVGGRGYGDDMPDANTRIDSLREDMRVIGDMVLDLQVKVSGHDRRFDQIDAHLAEHGSRFDAVDARLDRIQGRLDAHDARFDAVDARLDRIDGRLDAHDARFDAHDARFDHIDAQLAEILARLPQRSRSRR